VNVHPISTAEFESFVRRFEDPLLQDVAEYERWKSELGLLRTFWACRETRLALLGLEEGRELRGMLRVLKVPFFERKREFQRRRVGTAILREALRLCRERGARRMLVTRVLRAITKINESDQVALRFYLDCGGEILREYRGFRRKKRPRPLQIPPLSGF